MNVLGFLDIHPISLGHTVIIPKNHSENILDLKDDNLEPLFKAVKTITFMLQKTFNPEGFTIGINHGRVSGQAIDHLHVHVIPRFEGDKGGSLHSVVSNPPDELIQITRKKILESNGS